MIAIIGRIALIHVYAIFSCVNVLAPSYLSDRLVTRSTVHDLNTRNKNYLNIASYQSASGLRTFLYRAIKLWTSLPRATTAADSLRTFKKKLRKFLFLVISCQLGELPIDVFIY